MSQSVLPIRAGINCYLLPGAEGFVLVDTGPAVARRRLLRGLCQAGCGPGDLRLAIITHGDADHIGCCVLLRDSYGAKLASHEAEVRALETGRMENRKERPDRKPWFFRALLPLGMLFGRAETFSPDTLLEDSESLESYGVDATILHLPGHTRGSIAVFTGEGDLICGDLFWSMHRPRLHPLIDDLDAARASVERIRSLSVRRILPAHGRPFSPGEVPMD